MTNRQFTSPDYGPRKPVDTYQHMEDRLDAIRQAMRTIIAEMDETVIGHYYRLGQEALKVDKLPTMDLDVHWRTLHDCRRLAREVPEAEFFRLAKPPVRWTHVRMLLVAGELTNFEKWVKRITEETLTSSDLASELRLVCKSRQEGARRHPSPPKTFRYGLGQLEKISTSFLSKLEHALFCPSFDVAQEVQNHAPDELTVEVREMFAAAAANLSRIAEQARLNADRMSESLAWMDRVMAERTSPASTK
jgi:hypothetical protein